MTHQEIGKAIQNLSLEDQIIEAVERSMFDLDNPGFCMGCGEEQGGCEPDARHYACEVCSEKKVFGAEELCLYV